MTTQPIQSTTDDLIAEIEAEIKHAKESCFEQWLERSLPSGDASDVTAQWEASSELADLLERYRYVIAPVERVRELEQADRWRDIDEEMPEEDVRVLVWCDDGADAWPDTASHHNSFFTDEYRELLPVTHWKPVTPP